MSISYSIPLSQAWNQMKKELFQPFDLNKWMRLGFTAWLAGLTDCQGSGGNGSGNGRNEWDDFFSFPDTAWNWLQSHPLWFNLIIIGVILLIIFGTFLVWVNSRGKFMFLHNVAKGKNEISQPWIEYRKEGNSLFVWRFFFGWIAFALLLVFLGYCFITAKDLYYGNYPNLVVFWKISAMILLFLVYLVTVGYISLFLNDFVIPVMYKYRSGINAGWFKFLGLFARYFHLFLIYGLFILALHIVAAIAILILGLATCCIGLLLIIIPYIGTVLLLPVSYTFRALSIRFLAQFGDDYNVFTGSETPVDLPSTGQIV